MEESVRDAGCREEESAGYAAGRGEEARAERAGSFETEEAVRSAKRRDGTLRAPRQPQSFDGSLQKQFALPEKDWEQYSPLTLAYLGDAVFELVVRTIVVKQENRQPQKLHRLVTSFVSARAQSRMAARLLPLLSAEETAVYRRGRNAKPYTKAKNATIEEYLEATGLEALFGYLYLCGSYDRLQELIALGLSACQEDKKESE